jgi:hypothetical protein
MPLAQYNVDRRFSDKGNATYTVKRIWERHKEIGRLHAIGLKHTQIARMVGVTPQTVSNVLNNAIVQTNIVTPLSTARDNDAKSITKRLQEVAPLAIDLLEKTIRTVVDSPDNMQDPKMLSVGVRAALGNLDMVVPRQPQSHLVGHVTFEQLQEMKNRANPVQNLVPAPVEAEVILE